MPAGAQILGYPEFVATMAVAAATMQDLPGLLDAAKELAVAASSEAPRLTGRLAASLTAVKETRGAGTVTSPLVYAVPIHWGRPAHNIEANPFIMRAADASDRYVGELEKSAQRTLDKVRGI